jgi:mannose-6-phosphate isomerase
MTERWHHAPWRLPPNRVSRFYRGGLLLDRFRGVANPSDTDEPEDWVGSATRAWTPPSAPPTDEGLAWAEIDGERRLVADLLSADPAAIAGPEIAASGATTGVLVKLLDAGTRLAVHAHPSRAFAGRHLASVHGKAEAWIVLATREIEGDPPPNVRLGFRRDVGRDELVGWIARGATEALLDAMESRPTRPGDVWYVPPGMPHAIGAGILILEVQEPTDFSIVLESRGVAVGADDLHLGLSWEVAIEAIDRRAVDDAALGRLRSMWQPDSDPGRGREEVLPPPARPFFRAERVVAADGAAVTGFDDRFLVGVVTAGSGLVATDAGHLPVRVGEAFAVPASASGSLRLEAPERLEAIVARAGEAPRG